MGDRWRPATGSFDHSGDGLTAAETNGNFTGFRAHKATRGPCERAPDRSDLARASAPLIEAERRVPSIVGAEHGRDPDRHGGVSAWAMM